MVAVLSLSVLTAPPDALAKQKKTPPGQAKKINFQMMNDVRNHWAVEPVTALQKEGIIKGYADGNYYPQSEVSRSESLVMLMRALGLEGGDPSKAALKAAADCPDWAKDTVALAIDKGIITEEEAEELDFSKPALRYEVAVWLGRAQNDDVSAANLTFADSGKIPGYAKKYVAFMAQNKVINGYPGNIFGPLNTVKRSEIASMLFKCQSVFSLNNKFGYISGEVKDVLPSDPAYIMLTANAGEMMIQVADDAAIFVDGEAADLDDIEEGDYVTLVLNPTRKAIVVSAQDGENNNDDEDEDSDAPEIAGLSPKDGAKDAEIGLKQLVATFDENIQAVKSESDVESKIEITNETDDQTVEIKDVDITGKKLTIYLADGLEADCEYTVYIRSGIIEDEDGNNFGGLRASDWNFSTFEEDSNAPEIAGLSPKDGAKDVEIGLKQLVANFDENIQAVKSESDVESKIEITNETDDQTVEIKDVDITGKKLIIYLADGLETDCEYTVYIPRNIIEDKDGNSFEGIDDSDWNFTTAEDEDNTAPKIDGSRGLDPRDNDVVVGSVYELTARFDENVQWADDDEDYADKITIFNDNNEVTPDDIELKDDELVIKFDKALADGEYSVIIPRGIIEDEAGNSFKGIGVNGWNFEIR
ncbi:Ig-like domain-containing protein [Desulfotomaculum arcticum]|uniref:Ig-like domain-containing protein n=2 Tax=Desulfotruncus TaxID=2867377 RepID=A0A1I2XXA8_9FIRM|nr:Ig-like domain-containing protein [Desulfotomaculum arcticum] [Desulfotruncus arcticus DSM 17038]